MRNALWLVACCLWLAASGALAQEPPADVAEEPLATGQRISLDLKGVDILDVLKLLSQKSRLNFVAGRNVAGRVTIFVGDVDVWEAFERIIDANDLAYERQGDIVTVMTSRDYELLYGQKFQERIRELVIPLKHAKVVQIATVLNQMKSTVGRVVADEATNTLIIADVPGRLSRMQELLKALDRPSQTRVYRLNYAEAEPFKEKVQELLTPLGTFSFDKRTNTVVITDLPEVLLKTDRIVKAFDVPDGQVRIDAKIIKVVLNDDLSLGIDWQKIFNNLAVGSSTVTPTLRLNTRILSDIIDGTATGGALRVAQTSGTDSRVIIEALRQVGKTDTLSNPQIMVSNNQEAKILVGTKQAFVTVTTTVPTTGSVVSSPQIQFVDVGTKLYVTPNIKRDGYIQMKIRPEVSSATIETFQTNRIPIVTSTEAETNVLVKSGSTLIIGGLIDEAKGNTQNRVPILGDIPLIGNAFRSTAKTYDKTELVVFLTPQIILGDGSPYVPPPEAEASTAALPEVILQDPVPAGYRHLVRQKLQAHLVEQFQAAALSRGSVVLSFVLNQAGKLVGTPAVTSEDGEPFVLAAQTALTEAEPFPPFPTGAHAEEIRFRLAVEYAPEAGVEE